MNRIKYLLVISCFITGYLSMDAQSTRAIRVKSTPIVTSIIVIEVIDNESGQGVNSALVKCSYKDASSEEMKTIQFMEGGDGKYTYSGRLPENIEKTLTINAEGFSNVEIHAMKNSEIPKSVRLDSSKE